MVSVQDYLFAKYDTLIRKIIFLELPVPLIIYYTYKFEIKILPHKIQQ